MPRIIPVTVNATPSKSAVYRRHADRCQPRLTTVAGFGWQALSENLNSPTDHTDSTDGKKQASLPKIRVIRVIRGYVLLSCVYGMPRTMLGPIQRVNATGSRCQMRIIRWYLGFSGRISEMLPSRK